MDSDASERLLAQDVEGGSLRSDDPRAGIPGNGNGAPRKLQDSRDLLMRGLAVLTAVIVVVPTGAALLLRLL